MKNVWVVFEHGKMVFFGCVVFEVLMLLWFVFGVFGLVPEVLKMLVFSQFFGASVGWLILVYFGFGRFRCVCVSDVCFCFLCCFCFCLFALFLFCSWIVFWCWFLFCFFFVFLFFFFCFFFCLFVFVLLFAFLSLFFNRQKLFPPKKGIVVVHYFLFSLCLFLAFLGPPPFSLSLSWCLSCSFRSSFLVVSHFCILFLFFLFVLFVFSFQVVLLFLFVSACCLFFES